jgi:hypothetical protein
VIVSRGSNERPQRCGIRLDKSVRHSRNEAPAAQQSVRADAASAIEPWFHLRYRRGTPLAQHTLDTLHGPRKTWPQRRIDGCTATPRRVQPRGVRDFRAYHWIGAATSRPSSRVANTLALSLLALSFWKNEIADGPRHMGHKRRRARS